MLSRASRTGIRGKRTARRTRGSGSERTCVSGGASFVLYSPIAQTVYQLDDQKKPAEFAGQKVRIIGTLDKTTKVIHVTEIQAEV